MYDNFMKKYFWSLFLILLMTPSVANAHEQVKESKKIESIIMKLSPFLSLVVYFTV